MTKQPTPGLYGSTAGEVAVSADKAMVTIPVEPSDDLLRSMAIRYDHGLAIPGYYDQPVFGAENIGQERRMEAALRSMRQLHEEVVGTGFYRYPASPSAEITRLQTELETAREALEVATAYVAQMNDTDPDGWFDRTEAAFAKLEAALQKKEATE